MSEVDRTRRRAVPSVAQVAIGINEVDPMSSCLWGSCRLMRAITMRAVALCVICVASAGCLSYRTDQRVIGRFRAATGEVLDIRSDGWIHFVTRERDELVGLAAVDRDQPLSIRIIAPDTSPLVGTTITFWTGETRVTVDWADWRRLDPESDRPTEFRKE